MGTAANTRTDEFSDGVVCFAGTDWWYHPRGHSECQIMRRLARQTTVIWVNSIGMRAPKPGVTRKPLARCWRKLASTLRGIRRDGSGMWVLSPLFIPRYSPRFVRINGWLVSVQVRALCRALRISRPACWVTVPTAAHAAVRVPAHRRVFNRCDDFAQFPQAHAPTIRALERLLLTSCDSTVFASRELFERERRISRNPVLLEHGVDFDHFARERDDTTKPACLSGTRTTIIGFYGGVEDYTVDLDLLRHVARRFRDSTLVIAGPRSVGTEALESEPNVRVLGPIPYEDLPSVACWFDVGLMPWKRNAWIRACNPIKLREYLALGFPIVSSPFPALTQYRQHIGIGLCRESFLQEISKALEGEHPIKRRGRRNAVRSESWERRSSRVATLLGLPAAGAPTASIEPKAVEAGPEQGRSHGALAADAAHRSMIP